MPQWGCSTHTLDIVALDNITFSLVLPLVPHDSLSSQISLHVLLAYVIIQIRPGQALLRSYENLFHFNFS